MTKQGKYLTAFQRKLLEKKLQTEDLRSEYQRRIKIMLLADSGLSKTEISEVVKCSIGTARYWSAQAKAGQAHKWQDCPRGRPKIANAECLALLQKLAKNSPREYGYPFQRWTGQWLSTHLNKELGIKLSSRHVCRLLKQMGLSTRARSTTRTSDTVNAESRLTLRELSVTSAPASSAKCQLDFLN